MLLSYRLSRIFGALSPTGCDTWRGLIETAKSHAFNIRIGIATGGIATGVIGNNARQSFTVYVPVENLSSRLEAQAKALCCGVLFDQATRVGLAPAMMVEALDAVEMRELTETLEMFTHRATTLL